MRRLFILTGVVAGIVVIEAGGEGAEDMEMVPIEPIMQMLTLEVAIEILRILRGLILLVETEK